MWTLELMKDVQRLTKGESDVEADVELKASEKNFVKIIMGQLTPQTVPLSIVSSIYYTCRPL